MREKCFGAGSPLSSSREGRRRLGEPLPHQLADNRLPAQNIPVSAGMFIRARRALSLIPQQQEIAYSLISPTVERIYSCKPCGPCALTAEVRCSTSPMILTLRQISPASVVLTVVEKSLRTMLSIRPRTRSKTDRRHAQEFPERNWLEVLIALKAPRSE